MVWRGRVFTRDSKGYMTLEDPGLIERGSGESGLVFQREGCEWEGRGSGRVHSIQ